MQPDISIQLYTVRELAATDIQSAFRALAHVGYQRVELAGLYGHTAPGVKRILDACGLAASGAHVSYEDATSGFEALLQEYACLEVPEITVPYLPEQARTDVEAWLRTASRLEALAAEADAHGVTFSYHNHAFEFEPVGGTCGFDLLVEKTELLAFQVDVYWVAHGGRSPADLVSSLSGRLRSAHLKDLREDGEDVEWGLGILDHEAILDACGKAAVRTLVIELDNPKMEPIASAATSLKNLSNMLGAHR